MSLFLLCPYGVGILVLLGGIRRIAASPGPAHNHHPKQDADEPQRQCRHKPPNRNIQPKMQRKQYQRRNAPLQIQEQIDKKAEEEASAAVRFSHQSIRLLSWQHQHQTNTDCFSHYTPFLRNRQYPSFLESAFIPKSSSN